MRQATLLIIFLAASACMADAEILQGYWVRNFNTLQPVDGVDVTIYNDTFSLSNTTDLNGMISFYLNDTGNFTVSFSKTAYETKLIQRIISQNTTEDILLNPQSTNGIIKLHVIDLTGGRHTTCVYYAINSRLKECIEYNETGYIQIYTSTNYTFKPVMRSIDMFSNPSTFVKYYKIWLPLLAGLVFLSIVVVLAFIVIWRIWLRRKKK